jgi:hypothetical protein
VDKEAVVDKEADNIKTVMAALIREDNALRSIMQALADELLKQRPFQLWYRRWRKRQIPLSVFGQETAS